ncbi:MAG: phage portal protein [Patescibacteria group bacterium]|nr:phage portal protein [Patescibacteria group bacterium]
MDLQTGIFSELLNEQRARLAVLAESRSSLENPQTPLSYPAEWLLDIFNGGRTDSGIRVSELTAFQAAIFLACVDLISGVIASLPKQVFERTITGNGRAAHRVAYEHDYYDLINIEPNDEMSRFVFDKAFMAHVLAWGNGYSELQRDAGNSVVAMWPRNPYKTRPHRLTNATRLAAQPWRPFPVDLPAGSLVYRTTDGIEELDHSDLDAENGPERLICKEDMIHLPGLAFDGRIGQSVVWLARQTIGLALATEKFGAKYFANFARPSGILTAPALKKEDREQAKQSWMEAQGGENAHRVAVMPPGFNFTPISNKPDESQMSQTEESAALKICAFFHMPPHMVGVGKLASRSNTEQFGQEFISYTLGQWLAGLRVEYKRKMFPSRGVGRAPRNRFFMDFDMADLQRADSAAREAFYASGRQWGYLNTNDIRGFEKLNPIEEPWAEDYWMPINMTLADTPLDPNSQDGAGNGKKDGDPVDERYVRHYSRLFSDAFGRILNREKRDLKAISATFAPVLFSIRDGLFDLAAIELRVKGKPGAESDRFVAEYMGGMTERCSAWAADEAEKELRRSLRALRVAVFREAAALKAKSLAESEGEPDAD